MRYDESFTFLNYANRDFFSLFAYTHPNNHMPHRMKMTTDLFTIAQPSKASGAYCRTIVYSDDVLRLQVDYAGQDILRRPALPFSLSGSILHKCTGLFINSADLF